MPARRKSTRRNKKGKKTRKIRRQRGGASLETMPQLCFGTVQTNLEKNLIEALKIGYRHIDGAEAYVSLQASGYIPIDYKKTVKEILSKFKTGENGLPKVERKDLWITWKDNGITKEKIARIIEELDCGYIDLFLVHHSCGTDSDFKEFKEAQKDGLIRYYGVSNCENIEQITRLKSQHNIYANQIQARPPGGKVSGRRDMSPDFIQQCNTLNVKILLFSTTSGVSQLENYSPLYSIEDFDLNMLNKYYIQKFLKPSNVIIVASQTGISLQPNFDSVNTFLKDGELLSSEKMKEIEETLQKITLAHM